MDTLSQTYLNALTIGGKQIKGPAGFTFTTIGEVVNRVMTLLLPISGIILFLVIIWGGYDFLLSQGNPDRVKAGQQKITAGIIGIVIMIFSYVAVRLAAMIFGLEDASPF